MVLQTEFKIIVPQANKCSYFVFLSGGLTGATLTFNSSNPDFTVVKKGGGNTFDGTDPNSDIIEIYKNTNKNDLTGTTVTVSTINGLAQFETVTITIPDRIQLIKECNIVKIKNYTPTGFDTLPIFDSTDGSGGINVGVLDNGEEYSIMRNIGKDGSTVQFINLLGSVTFGSSYLSQYLGNDITIALDRICTTGLESMKEFFSYPSGTIPEYIAYIETMNQDISNWDTSNVLNMDSMFRDAFLFKQDISNWNVINIPLKPTDFDTNNKTTWKNNTELQPRWGTDGTPTLLYIKREFEINIKNILIDILDRHKLPIFLILFVIVLIVINRK